MIFSHACRLYSTPRMHADDTTLNIIQSWLKVNKLTLNVKKTKYLLIGSRPKLDLVPDNFTVKVNNIFLERVTVYKSLGVLVDENLTWKAHIDEISKKTSASLSVLRRLIPTIPLEIRETMYKVLIVPYFDYSNWKDYQKNSSNSRIAPLELDFLNYQTRSKNILNELGWEALEDRSMKQIAILMYKITRSVPPPPPPYLRNIFCEFLWRPLLQLEKLVNQLIYS